jgi:hypothetical protein
MEKNKVYQYYTELPGWAKGIVVIGGSVVLFLVGRKLYKYAFPSQEEIDRKKLSQEVDNEISDFEQAGQKPSYTDSQYTSFANIIHNSMRYCAGDDYGTVEATMKKMKNDIDVAKLIKSFGVKKDYCFGINTGEFDLFTYVQKELGNDYGGITNYRIRNINDDWRTKGITYQL